MMATELQRTVSQFRFGERATARPAEPSVTRTRGRVVGRLAPAAAARRADDADERAEDRAA
jgi:hypothetical protein